VNSPDPLPSDTLFLADNLALDFINTAYGVGEGQQDCLVSDEAVVNWLKMAGQLTDDFEEKPPKGLLVQAHALRDCGRAVVTAAIAGAPADLATVNQVLDAGQPTKTVEWDGQAQAFRIATRRRNDDPASLLEPVAASLANLLTSDKFEYVKQCEAHDCVLLFHDLTKSHRRRWCSMATCGNRMKVAAFRSRKKAD
jgi:predicted RNA-binding Zn ribbon-like protein